MKSQEKTQPQTPSFTALTSYGCRAEKFWRRYLPRMVAELERRGKLAEVLMEAEERTAREADDLSRHFRQQGLAPEQAQNRAWEIVQFRYLYLRPERY